MFLRMAVLAVHAEAAVLEHCDIGAAAIAVKYLPHTEQLHAGNCEQAEYYKNAIERGWRGH
jgi:hypothetical protein